MVLGRLTENTQKNENRNRNFENEIPKQTMDSVATVYVIAHCYSRLSNILIRLSFVSYISGN